MGEAIGVFLFILIGVVVVLVLTNGNPIDCLVRYVLKTRHFHTWGKWERKTCKMYKSMSGTKIPGSDFVQAYQERACKTCGKIETQDLTY